MTLYHTIMHDNFSKRDFGIISSLLMDGQINDIVSIVYIGFCILHICWEHFYFQLSPYSYRTKIAVCQLYYVQICILFMLFFMLNFLLNNCIFVATEEIARHSFTNFPWCYYSSATLIHALYYVVKMPIQDKARVIKLLTLVLAIN